MDHKHTIRIGLNAALVLATCVAGLTATASAQEKAKGEKVGAEAPVKVEKGGRDPFKRYEVVRKPMKVGPTKLEAPSIQVRIERYRAQKQSAAIAHVAPPKPTTALLLNEMQVIGIFRTPRGWAAMVEAVPIKLSYVVYPGEMFFDGQLVAIEETRLVLRRDIVWTDGKRERAVEIKPLRTPSPVEAMTTPASYTSADSERKSDEGSNGLSREEIETAIRQAKVLIGMKTQDVSRAWGDGHTNDSLVENEITTQIWRYSRGEVRFRNGVVVQITLLKG